MIVLAGACSLPMAPPLLAAGGEVGRNVLPWCDAFLLLPGGKDRRHGASRVTTTMPRTWNAAATPLWTTDMQPSPAFDPVAFGKRLRAVRQQRGLTQRHLGLYADVEEELISRLEGGRQAPSAAALVGLCHALEVSADYLLGLQEAP